MGSNRAITTLFLDVGGVLLTNGWDHSARERAAQRFKLDLSELQSRHALTFDTYEEGKLSLDEYLDRSVFYEKRSFSRKEFRQFMFDQSQPFPDMLALVTDLKRRWKLKVAVVSNEGRELMLHRIEKYKLTEMIDFFIVSCFVHFRKPDADIFRLALDTAQVKPNQVVYVEDRPMFVDIARGLGIHAIRHQDYRSTRDILSKKFRLPVNGEFQ